MQTKYEIEELLGRKTASGSAITSAFKAIAGGEENKMLDGVKIFYAHGIQKGKEKGICEGVILSSVIVCSGLAIKAGYKYIKNRIEEKQKNNEIGKEIYDAFDENLVDSQK